MSRRNSEGIPAMMQARGKPDIGVHATSRVGVFASGEMGASFNVRCRFIISPHYAQ
jgi:hypothetical protein